MNGNNYIIRTFPSTPVPVKNNKENLNGDFLQARKTVLVPVNGGLFEVGEGVSSASDPRSNRVLNTESFITSERYMALFLGALKMIPDDEIDLLVVGLPVSGIPRREELKKRVEGVHDLGDGRTTTVKSAWVIAQPLGGLFAYLYEGGQDRFNSIRNQDLLVVDPGYLTLDWLVTRGLVINENRSGDFEGGMSKILDKISSAAYKVFSSDSRFKGVKRVNVEIIDQAFITGTFKLYGHEMPFPVHKGDDKTPAYDFTKAIASITEEAVTALVNNVGDAQDLDRIILVGGPALLYKPALEKAFPFHTVQVLEDNLIANVKGFQVGGIQRAKALAKQHKMNSEMAV